MRVVVIGAGFGGLAAAAHLVRRGHDVTVLARIIHATLATETRGEPFRRLIETQVARRAAEMIRGPQLPLMPPRPGQRREGA